MLVRLAEALGEQRKLSLVEPFNKTNIFVSLIDYERSSLLEDWHLRPHMSSYSI